MCEDNVKDPRDLNGDGKVTVSEKIQYKVNQAKEKLDVAIDEAKEDAKAQTADMVEKAREQIENERETALRDIRRQVALLSVDVAEKVLREKLSNDQAQQALIDRFVNESRSNS